MLKFIDMAYHSKEVIKTIITVLIMAVIVGCTAVVITITVVDDININKPTVKKVIKKPDKPSIAPLN